MSKKMPIPKIARVAGAGLAGLFILVVLVLVSTLFYIESPHGTGQLQKWINPNIPGTLTWEGLALSPVKGTLEIRQAALADAKAHPVASFHRLFICLDPFALIHGNLVIKKISLETPRVTLEQDAKGRLNLLQALTTAPSSPPEPVPPDNGPMVLPFNIIAKDVRITQGGVSFCSPAHDMAVTLNDISLESHGDLAKKSAGLHLSMGKSRVRLPGAETAITSLTLDTAFLTDAVTSLALHVATPAGKLSLTGDARDLFTSPRLNLELNVDGDVAQAMETVAALELPADVSGRLSARATVQGALENPDISLSVDYPGGTLLGQKFREVHIRLAMADEVCRIPQLLVAHAHGTLSGKGVVDLSQAFPQGLLSPERHLSALAWDMKLSGKNLEPGPVLDELLNIPGISGTCQIDLDVSGGLSGPPRGTLRLTAAQAGYGTWPRTDADMALSLSRGKVLINTCRITSPVGEVNLSGHTALLAPDGMDLLKDPSVDLSLSTGAIRLESFHPHVPELAQQHIGGTLALSAGVAGTLAHPLADITITGDHLTAAGETIQKVTLAARADREKVRINALDVVLDDQATLRATGWADTRHRFNLALNTDNIRLSRIHHIQTAGLPADGVFSCTLTGSGTLENPQVQGNLALTALTFQEKPMADFTAALAVKDQYATLDGNLNFNIQAGYHLKTQDFNAHVLFKDMALAPWFQLADQPDMAGTLTGDIRLDGNARKPEAITVTGDIATLSLKVKEQFSVTARQISARLNGNTFKVSPFTTTLPGEGRLTLHAAGSLTGDIQAGATAHIPATTALLFTDAITDPAGEIHLEAQALIKKQFSASRINALITLTDLGATLPQLQSKLHGISGTIAADTQQVAIKDVTGFLDTGTFSLAGTTSLTDFMPQSYQATLTAKALPVTVPEGLDALFDLDLALEGTPERSALTGTLLLDSGTLTREINLNREILTAVTAPRTSRKGVVENTKPNPYLENLTLDLFVKARNDFMMDTNLAIMEIHPDLRIQGSPLAPVVSGRATIDSGTISHYNKEFTLSRGTIDFINPYKIEPTIDIEALHEVRDWDILLSVSGTPDELIFSLASDPTLEQADITSLLLRGKTTNELISAEGGTTFSPENALAQFAAASVQDDLRAATGLDILEVGFDDPEGNGGVGNVNLTVGKKLSDRMTLKYGTASEDGQMVQTTSAEYKISDTVIATGFQDSQGKFGGEIKYRLEFR